MKKPFFALVLFAAVFPVFAQRLPTVGILPFEAGAGVSAADAGEAARMITAELTSWRTMTILTGADAEGAEYLVRGAVSRQNNQFVITAVTTETRSGKDLNTSREQAAALAAIPLVSLCAKIVENVPYPNFLLGKWRSTINMPDGPLTCVMEFRSNRTVRVEQFDTWEHSGTNSLKYQAIGTGTYTYVGYLRRTITIDRREISSDATVGISLTLEDALPAYASVNAGGLRVLFNEERNSFELSYGGIPCGNNHTGPAVYPSARVYYTRFTKIQ